MCEEWARADLSLQKRGQTFGFIIAMIGVGGGWGIARTVSPAARAAVSGVTLLGIVAALLRQRNMKTLAFGDGKTDDAKPAANNDKASSAKSADDLMRHPRDRS
jgi:hypothetical protein